MRKIALLILPLLIIYFDNTDSFQGQKVAGETKWSLKIGIAPFEAYSQYVKFINNIK